jgi:hypothetical protein
MGTAAVGVSVVLLVAGRRREGHAAVVRWAWPAFLLVLGAVLLVYSEL